MHDKFCKFINVSYKDVNLSAQLFILCVEILACKIRQDSEIEGLDPPVFNRHSKTCVAKLAGLDKTTSFVKI